MNSKKSKRGVLVRLTAQEKGLFLNLDDLEELQSQSKTWQQREPFTVKEIDEQKFERMEFDEKELADFGYYILARLHAFRSMGEAL
ncbi:hypothetical protein [Marilutibacter spongiae]|uniref:Uncharacterized protein n=1 Tax=Marilutibacter spongiae TaxID=2025720 RepID=A0A7W3Y5J8_9GAMM|nr:hypothetical protein [Lysobacter spongiae]MBB1060045.1 hypothetical protein [Lysobacter spongiae]